LIRILTILFYYINVRISLAFINISFFPNLVKLITKPINNLIDEIIKSVTILSHIKDHFYKRNVKYSTGNYVIGIINVTKNNTLRNKYNE